MESSEIAAAGPLPVAARLRDIQSITDAALSRLDEPELLTELLDRTREALRADTAAVLLLDFSSGQLIATAAAGLEEEVAQGVRIPVGRGFAGRIAAEHRPVILDRVDHTTVLNPILWAKGIQSMVGVPMVAGGRVIGVLHVGSLTPRRFTGDDVELLQLAADRAAAAVQSMTAQADRAAVTALQRSLVPSALPAIAGAELAARYVPGSGAVGGDWYDVFTLPSGQLCVTVGDVAGSGLPAAVIMGRMRSSLRSYALETHGSGRGPGPARPQDAALRAGRHGHRAVRRLRAGPGPAARRPGRAFPAGHRAPRGSPPSWPRSGWAR